jgi:DNA-binding MarR family transcriptional regulator
MTRQVAMTATDTLLAIERELVVLLHRVRRVTVSSARGVHPDLQPAAYPILGYVTDHERVRAADVAEHFGIDKGAVSRHVVHLERLGLISRACDPGDRRAQTLVATPHGVERVEAVRRVRRELMADRLADWSAEDLESFVGMLRRYNEP